jgi:polysaccharide export outer membrane protein
MKNIHFLLISLVLIILSSCNSYEKLTYLQDGDLLYIQMVTENLEINQLFNPSFNPSSENSNNMRAENMYFQGYLVNDSGYIQLPILKRVEVKNYTINEIQTLISEKAKKYLKDAQIIVKLASFKFSVLGEVNSPGIKQISTNKVNIFEALAYAGDINYNGNRKNALIIRQTQVGTYTIRVDLTNKNLIASKNFYIMPNDVIYVEPLGSTLFREKASDYTFVISAIASTLTVAVLILNLSK